jgi:hypothetical protein
MTVGITVAIAGLALSAYSTSAAMSSADNNDRLRRQEEAKQAQFNKEKLEIADQIQARADAIIGVWTGSYLPVELATLAEVCSEPVEVARIALVSQRARGEIAKIYEIARRKELYCLTPQQVGLRLESEIMIATKQADTTAGLIRTVIKQEEARVVLVNAQRMSNKINMINPGRSQIAASTSALMAAASQYDKLSKEAAKNVEDAAYSIGRSVQAAVSNGSELLKGAKGLNAMGIFKMPEPIRQEPRVEFGPPQEKDVKPFVLTVETTQTDNSSMSEEG